ncbi:hypothetical protein [Aeromonas veronii]|uniref:hypothetical protein n=1 Tax=Aeromonas veronii TaxID=654 RepID=UPI00214D3F9B|nr:hypothetical protein [Aeromonas veronii]MCR3969359.1 hypothetical protein [Aeromonas veronii]MCR3981838.1 hypothetical protein [Aeromonas veronii]
MGEFSKKVGEHGELIVKNFLSMIGWLSVQEGETIPCEHGEKHKESSNAKTTHGIDAFYSVKSPGIQIISATLMDEWREVANC